MHLGRLRILSTEYRNFASFRFKHNSTRKLEPTLAWTKLRGTFRSWIRVGYGTRTRTHLPCLRNACCGGPRRKCNDGGSECLHIPNEVACDVVRGHATSLTANLRLWPRYEFHNGSDGRFEWSDAVCSQPSGSMTGRFSIRPAERG